MVGTNHPTESSRLRSRAACQSCNRRKVRCDVTQTGAPCSRCQNDPEAEKCEVLPRKKHRPRRPRQALDPSVSSTQHGDRQTPTNTISSTQESPLAQSIGPGLTSNVVGEVSASTLNDDADAVLPDDSSLSYIGDKRGPRLAVYDICHPSEAQDARQYVPQDSNNRPRKSYELEHMHDKGVFETLPNDVADEIIRCYFEHVHFFIPVVDAAAFLNDYTSNRHKLSPLLLWSMVLAAANFVNSDLLRKAGYSSRRAMKTAMYERAKCLYDFDRGTDKLVLIQSVILMGFWYTDPQDHTGAWYWIGIAISLCQNLGLHREPQSNVRGAGISDHYARHARRLWWTCFIRDRWVSLAKGRPMRIHHEDCDVPMPVAGDILLDIQQVPSYDRQKFIPTDHEALSSMWVRLVQISGALGDILRAYYRVTGPRPSVETLEGLADNLQGCVSHEPLTDGCSDRFQVHTYQVELFYQATVTVLYRPYVLGGPAALPATAPPSWHKAASEKARAAASSTNKLLEKLIELNAIEYLKPMMITALVPSMQVHLFDYKSSDPLISGLAKNRLQLCMLVLSKLRETYWSAGVMYRLFERAQQILQDSKSSNSGTISSSLHHLSHESTHSEHQPASYSQERLPNQSDAPVLESLAGWPVTNTSATDLSLWNDPLSFDTVDELLGPGFGLSSDAFEGLFPGNDISQLNPVAQPQTEIPQSMWFG